MLTIDAFWEKRNLGIERCLEIIIEETDEADEVTELLAELNAEYMVLKIPACKPEFLFVAQRAGFMFIESLINFTHDLKSHIKLLNEPSKRLVDATGYRKMNENEYSTLFSFLKEGIFDTDRVYLDTHFTHKQAADRYVGWIGDEINRGCSVYSIVYKNCDIGFFTNKMLKTGDTYPFLSGLYPKYKNKGFGLATIIKPIEVAIDLGAQGIDTYVSSNNTSQLRSLSAVGFLTKGINYVFVKHVNGGRK